MKNRYSKENLKDLVIVKCFYFLHVLVNLFLPIYSDGSLAYHSPFSHVSILFIGLGVYAMHGHFRQWVPTLPTIVSRTIEFITKFIKLIGAEINIVMFIIVSILDCTMLFLMYMDRTMYEYIEVESEVSKDDL